jgi:XTP/dITP diphosphohydrolase
LTERPRLVIASGNAGKLREYRDLLAGVGVELVAFDTDVDEVGETYGENARLKAEAAVEKSGLPALGDDSGLEVDALGGFPGIRSARLGPTQKERTAELLRRLEGVPRPWAARFLCVIALAAPGRETRFFQGECRGEIVPEWRGEAGFGYDPIFLVPGTGKTFGEMPPEEKRKYSHRAAAARALLESGALQSLADVTRGR